MPDTILLVEDSPHDVLFMTRALQKAGLENSLRVVEDGQQAIDYLSGKDKYADRGANPLPLLVLLDLKLPYVPGLEVLRWIRSQPALSKTIVVVLTSSDHPADIKASYALGANSFLSKPSNPDDLPELIKSVIDYWLKRNVPDRL
jgi:CheY-like chemotaxis protein